MNKISEIVALLKEGARLANRAYESSEGEDLQALALWMDEHEEDLQEATTKLVAIDNATLLWNTAILSVKLKMENSRPRAKGELIRDDEEEEEREVPSLPMMDENEIIKLVEEYIKKRGNE